MRLPSTYKMPKGIYKHKPRKNPKLIEIECLTCKHKFKAYPSQKKVYCGMSCRDIGYVNKFVGNKNGMWKGKEASYSAKHYRLDKTRGKPKRCEICGTIDINKKYEWANLTGNYDDVMDYKRMCTSCHRLFDNHKIKKEDATTIYI